MSQSLQKNNNDDKQQFDPLLKIGVPAAFIIPGTLLIPQSIFHVKFIDPGITGPIGDTIGGIAGPILNFIGLRYIYKTFQEQKEENANVNDRFEKEKNFQLLTANLKEYKDATANIHYAAIKKDIGSTLMDACSSDIGDYNQDIGSCYEHNHTDDEKTETVQIKSPETYYPKYIEMFNSALRNKSAAYRDFDYALNQGLLLIDFIDSIKMYEKEKEFLKKNFKLYLEKAGLNMHNDLEETIRASVKDYPTRCDIEQHQYIEKVVLKLESFDKLRTISAYYEKIS